MVARKVPRAVFCLLTALAFHRLITHVPHAVAIALPRTARTPRLAHPPLEVFRFSPASLHAGVESRRLDGVVIRVYSAEKTSRRRVQVPPQARGGRVPGGATDLRVAAKTRLAAGA